MNNIVEWDRQTGSSSVPSLQPARDKSEQNEPTENCNSRFINALRFFAGQNKAKSNPTRHRPITSSMARSAREEVKLAGGTDERILCSLGKLGVENTGEASILRMTSMFHKKAITLALYVNAALLACILFTLIGRDGRFPSILPAAYAQQQPAPIAGGGGLFLMPAQLAANRWGCFIMDIDTQVLAAYEYTPGDHNIRLVAAREFRWDRRLKQYNTEAPTPAEVRRLVEQQQDDAKVNQPEGNQPPAEK